MFGIRCQIGTSLDARKEQKKLFGSSKSNKKYSYKRTSRKADEGKKVRFLTAGGTFQVPYFSSRVRVANMEISS